MPGRRFRPLPLLPGPLIGRDREVQAIQQALLRGSVRLLTLTGPPGVGKTTLAVTAARAMQDRFAHGAALVDLSAVTTPDLVASTIADALELSSSNRQASERLLAFLHEQAMLLVLDNFEQVVAAAPLIADLLAACPDLRVLVTSREPLALRWERELPVMPLALPDIGRGGRGSGAAVLDAPASALFVERARAVSPSFAPTNGAARLVGEICHRLDGLPLALELAAVRVRVLSLESILQQLRAVGDTEAGHAASLDLLAGGPRDLPARQQTLRQAITWSYTLLRPAEQALLRRLAVFAGGCTLAAAQQVCEATLDGLTSLVEKNLVRQEAPDHGEPRLRLLEPIRHYAYEQLAASGDLTETRQRHARFVLALAEEGDDALLRAGHQEWLRRLDLDHDNVRAALRFALDHGDAETALRLAGALWRFWWVRGHLDEGAAWLDAALRHADRATPGTHARAMHAASKLARERGEYARAADLCDASIRQFRALDDRAGLAMALNTLANITGDRGDYPAATALYEESRDRWRALGNEAGAALALHNLAAIARASGDLLRAEALCDEALASYRALGDAWGVAISLANLAQIAYLGRDFDRAEALARDSLERRRTLGDRQGVVRCLETLAEVAAAVGGAQAERGARLFGAVDSMRQAIGFARPPDEHARYDAALAALHAALTPAAFADAWEAGRALEADEVVREALAPARHQPPTASEPSGPTAPVPPTGLPGARPAGGARPGGQPPTASAPIPPLPGGDLTRREREVVGLLAAGLTNRQIARRLVVTEGTAANYVRRTLQRLGFQNRAQAAAWAATHGLGVPGDDTPPD